MTADSLVPFRRWARFGAVLAAIVVVVGAWVRLTNAGLGCPDWPGCYGHVHPAQVVEQVDTAQAAYASRPFDYQKALHEMVHRYIASTLGLVVLGLAVYAWRHRRNPRQPTALPLLLPVVIGAQGALGAFTVTLLLTPIVVTSHLLGGLTTLSILWWLSLAPEYRSPSAAERSTRGLALIAFAALLMQLFLGGWTSTNYAAVACPDFPTCQGSYQPPMAFSEAFRVTHEVGKDYEGGVLSQAARTAIHYTHRIGAIVAGTLLFLTGLLTALRARSPRVRKAGLLLMGAVVLQWLIGMNLIWQGFPLALGTAHNAGAVLLLLATLTVLRRLWPARNAGP
jgi:cytochrome c oxidase assembly protein subunit 15